MTLTEYLGGEGAPSLTDLSAMIGVSKGRLSQLREAEDWPADLALKIEAVTDGALNASELSSIVYRARKDAA